MTFKYCSNMRKYVEALENGEESLDVPDYAGIAVSEAMGLPPPEAELIYNELVEVKPMEVPRLRIMEDMDFKKLKDVT